MAANAKGYSLMELMVVVAIIGIITSIAYPSYMESVRRTNRTEGKAELVDVAQRLQRCYTTYGSFNDVTLKRCTVYEDLVDGTAIKSRGSAYYDLTITNVTPTTYLLRATAVKAPQTKDTAGDCNRLTLDQRGERLPVGCW